jgi:4-oxalocrotonate tautomerase
MPLVRISLPEGKPSSYKRALSDGVHQAMVDTINVPADDRFQILSEHPKGDLVAHPTYLGVDRSADVVFVQVTLNVGRTVEMKKKLYARMAELLSKNAGLRPQDLIISLLEVPKENWSFGNGAAQYAP